MEFSELALPAEGASSAGRALSPAPSALSPACELRIAHVDAEDHVGNNLLQIWELMFGPKTKLFQTSSTRVGQDFEVEVQARF